jgi:hypothetical protein
LFQNRVLSQSCPDPDFSMDWDYGPDKQAYPFRGLVWPVEGATGASKLFTTG